MSAAGPSMHWEVAWVDGRVWIHFQAVRRWWHAFLAPWEFYAKLTPEQARSLGEMLLKAAAAPPAAMKGRPR